MRASQSARFTPLCIFSGVVACCFLFVHWLAWPCWFCSQPPPTQVLNSSPLALCRGHLICRFERHAGKWRFGQHPWRDGSALGLGRQHLPGAARSGTECHRLCQRLAGGQHPVLRVAFSTVTLDLTVKSASGGLPYTLTPSPARHHLAVQQHGLNHGNRRPDGRNARHQWRASTAFTRPFRWLCGRFVNQPEQRPSWTPKACACRPMARACSCLTNTALCVPV